MTGNEWKRLGDCIVDRRIKLHMKTTKSLAEKTGLTARMLGDIEKGRRDNYTRGTLIQIENALDWAPGSIDAILGGGDPTPKEDILPPLSEVQPFKGTNALRWRTRITAKPESERTEEEVAWLAASRAEQNRLGELAQRQGVESFDEVVDDADWIPEDAPASRQPRWSSFKSRTFEEIFNEWQVARATLLNLELEYAIGRKIPSEDAPTELADVLQMITENRNGTGRPWTPPWDPGPQFGPEDEPWKAGFWLTTEKVPAPEGLPGTIHRIGMTFDLDELRRRRELEQQQYGGGSDGLDDETESDASSEVDENEEAWLTQAARQVDDHDKPE